MESGIEYRRGDNIRDININYTSCIFIKRLLQKKNSFFFFIYAFSSSRNSEKSFIHTNCKFICFLITFFRSSRGGDRRNLYNISSLELDRINVDSSVEERGIFTCERVIIDRRENREWTKGINRLGAEKQPWYIYNNCRLVVWHQFHDLMILLERCNLWTLV